MTIPTRLLAAESDTALLRQPQVEWVLERLRRVGVDVLEQRDEAVPPDAVSIALRAAGTAEARASLATHDSALPAAKGAYALVGAPAATSPRVDLIAGEGTGALYGLLELGERLVDGDLEEVLAQPALVRSPETAVRAIGRAFTSAGHDLEWYRSEAFWVRYLDMLAGHRFNQLDLALGIAYDFPIHITDAYFLFAYPFLVDVEGYHVSVSGLSSEERESNLAMLQFVAQEAARRGIDLHLGLWTHSFANADSPRANHAIEGLDEKVHAEYCRDALTKLLTLCPEIGGITLRTHGESGVPEGSEAFWATLFQAVGQTRPTGSFTIDLHAKGLTEEIIDLAHDAGARAVVSAKYSAEHLGLPYQQASIRELDRMGRQTIASSSASITTGDAVRETARRLMGLSLHSRSATRYSYGDFLREDRVHEVIYRIWPGTQKLLVWADPLFAAAYAEASRFCGSSGIEIMEPLSFRGRRGSGLSGGTARSGYRPEVSIPWEYDWEKYEDTYAVWGRALYGANLPARKAPRPGATDRLVAGTALASRILPLVTSAHLPSAACVHYWPEIYTIPPVSRHREESATNPYRGDTLPPARLGTVSAADPAIFSSAREFAEAHVRAKPDGRYSPLDVADWLEDLAAHVAAEVSACRAIGGLDAGDELRLSDVEALGRLGLFFARLQRAAVGYELYDLTRTREHLAGAVDAFEGAISVFGELAADLVGLYVDDLAFGEVPEGRGSWKDRLPAMHEELAQLRAELAALAPGEEGSRSGEQRLPALLQRRLPALQGSLSARPSVSAPGSLEIWLDLEDGAAAGEVTHAALHFRPVDQLLAYENEEMERRGTTRFMAPIPAEVLERGFAVQYFCELWTDGGRATRLPGLGPFLDGVPYMWHQP